MFDETWRYNIPEQGVLCRVWQSYYPQDKAIRLAVIIKYDPTEPYPYIADKDLMGSWECAEPVTYEDYLALEPSVRKINNVEDI